MANPSILRGRIIQFTDVLLMSSHPTKPEDISHRQKKIHHSVITDLDLKTCAEVRLHHPRTTQHLQLLKWI